MSAERKLVGAILIQADVRLQWDARIDHILATPAVQAALAEVRKEGVAIGAAYAFCPPASHAKPEPVLRWEGDTLMLGEHQVGSAWHPRGKNWAWLVMGKVVGTTPTLTEARTAAETAVREWLQRAGLV